MVHFCGFPKSVFAINGDTACSLATVQIDGFMDLFDLFDSCGLSIAVRILQASLCCSSVTLLYVCRAFRDKCPVRLCITCSGKLA